jgi:hypothetical protein
MNEILFLVFIWKKYKKYKKKKMFLLGRFDICNEKESTLCVLLFDD